MEKQKLKFDKYLITRMLLAIGIFFLLVLFKSFGAESYASGRFNDSYKLIQALIQNGYYSWWLYFLATIGHLIIPDNINLSSQAIFLQNFLPVKGTLTGILFIEALLSIIILLISSYPIFKSKKIIYYLPPIIFNISWFIFLVTFSKIDFRTSNDIYFAISLGGQFLFWAIWFFTIGRKTYPEISSALIISIFWIVSLTILYWLFTPYYIIETTGRYMTMGAAGMAIFLGTFSTYLFRNANSYASKTDSDSRFLGSLYLGIPLLILAIFLFTNFQTGQNYFNVMYQNRNKDLTEKTWNTLLSEVPHLDPSKVSLFYFTTDNPASLEGVLIFGFYMRAGIEWRIPVEALTPLYSTDYQQLLDYVKTGEPALKIHGRKTGPIPLDRVFAFDFRNGELINITDQVRKQVAQDLSLPNP